MDSTNLNKQRITSCRGDSDSVTSSPQPQPIDKSKTDEIFVPDDNKQKGVATNINKLDYSGWSCILCGNRKLKRLPQCEHGICDECIMPFITEMIRNSAHGFKCPKASCTVMWTVEHCLEYLPREVAERMIQVDREARILANPQYFFCPFPKCGEPIVDDLKGCLIRACTSCWKVFCTSCRVHWHMGMTCSQYQALVQAANLWFPYEFEHLGY